jgi:hypothetical protein
LLRAEIVGVVAAVSMGFILDSLLGDIDPTAEMLSRTRPNLFDLFVASALFLRIELGYESPSLLRSIEVFRFQPQKL